MTPLLRRATAQDVLALLEIEGQCFSAPNWAAAEFATYETWVAEVAGRIAGFLVARQTFPARDGEGGEREILNIAVAPDFRRKGIATLLLQNELERGGLHFLEVRESNTAAQALYRKLGFSEIGRRSKYYDHPAETAIVMQLKSRLYLECGWPLVTNRE